MCTRDSTWVEGVELELDKDTNPALVGAITSVKGAQLIEAQESGAMGGNGGVRLTAAGGDSGKGLISERDGTRTYYARLWESAWARWTPATQDRQ